MIRIADEQLIVLFKQNLLHRKGEGGKERIGAIGHHKTDGFSAIGSKTTSGFIGHIIHLLRRYRHPFFSVRMNSPGFGTAVDHQTDGGDGNGGRAGNFFDGTIHADRLHRMSSFHTAKFSSRNSIKTRGVNSFDQQHFANRRAGALHSDGVKIITGRRVREIDLFAMGHAFGHH